jgi:hypothetical protein
MAYTKASVARADTVAVNFERANTSYKVQQTHRVLPRERNVEVPTVW